jgi:hypothetical protein
LSELRPWAFKKVSIAIEDATATSVTRNSITSGKERVEGRMARTCLSERVPPLEGMRQNVQLGTAAGLVGIRSANAGLDDCNVQ